MIRRLNEDDLTAIIMLDELGLNSNWHVLDYRSEILNKDSLCLGLEIDAELFGFIIFRKSFLDAELMQVMIRPDKQGNSFGSQLMKKAEDILLLEGVSDLHLEVSETNKKAITFYKKLGFIQIRMRKNYYGHGQDAWVMRKRLVE